VKGKSCKTFDIIISTKYMLFNWQFWGVLGGLGAAAWQPLSLGVPLVAQVRMIVVDLFDGVVNNMKNPHKLKSRK
jgi:hypothetical protein